jgi:Zn-finger domain-containing protein
LEIEEANARVVEAGNCLLSIIRAAITNNNDFEVGVGLSQNGLQRTVFKNLCAVISRDDNRNERILVPY